MSVKLILFDIDGVLIRIPYYYSKELEEQGYKDASKHTSHYFHSDEHHRCSEGKGDIREEIVPYLEKISWDKTAEDYLRESFVFERQYLDDDLIDYIGRLQQKDIICYLCSDQEKYRASYLLEEMNFAQIFDGRYFSCEQGFRKCQEGFWQKAIIDLKTKFPQIKPTQILYFDDGEENVAVAKQFGVQANVFKDVEQMKKVIEDKL